VSETLRRIAAGYARAAPVRPTGEWAWIRERYAVELRDALASGEEGRLGAALENVLVGDASFGLVSPAFDQDVAEWERTTCESRAQLELPAVAGLGSLHPDAPRHAHLATRIASLVGGKATIVDIGGGYGGFYAQLRRVVPGVRYIDLDLPETLAIFDHVVSQLTDAEIAWYPDDAEVRLVSAGERTTLEVRIDLVCNFRSFSEMSFEDVAAYFAMIERLRPRWIFHENATTRLGEVSDRGHVEILASDFPVPAAYQLLGVTPSPWLAGGGRYGEHLYELRV
jgi:hypothetical protein